MIRYRNKMTGRELDLPEEDPAFEASEGWEAVEITPARALGFFDPKPLYTPPAILPDDVPEDLERIAPDSNEGDEA